jgi:hypothetical protein
MTKFSAIWQINFTALLCKSFIINGAGEGNRFLDIPRVACLVRLFGL